MCSVSRLRRASECYYIVMHIQLQGGETLGSRVRQRPLSIEYGLEEEEGGRPADNSLLMNCEVDFSKGQTELCCFTHLHSAQLSSTQLDSARLSSTQLNSARLSSTQLDSARLSLTQLDSARLSSTQLKSARISSTQLDLARLSSTNNLNQFLLFATNTSWAHIHHLTQI